MYKILTSPNRILNIKSSLVKRDDPEINDLIEHLLLTALEDPNCVGISAIQVGIPKQLFLLGIDKQGSLTYLSKETCKVFINPTIISQSTDIVDSAEGCLSIPDTLCFVKRFKSIKIKYTNERLHRRVLHAKDDLSCAIQHEMDHLLGILMTDKNFTF